MSQQEFEEFLQGKDIQDDDKMSEICVSLYKRFPNQTDKQLLEWLECLLVKQRKEFEDFAKGLPENLSGEDISDKIKARFPERNEDMLNRQIASYLKQKGLSDFMKWAEDAQAEIDSSKVRQQVLPIVKAILQSKNELKPVIEMFADVFIERWLARTK
jgi:hypothetical protein